ncbi:MAG: tRNA pseudouridine(38-40) synthase TruA [Alphaproteobacteria bacterium]|nr:tRNA pseudouridine(38-40) synthase TruA [Alphaproteobacteria bacterium]
MQRYKLTIEYRGTDYAGWQRQKDARSIQQEIEEAIFAFSGQDATIHAAGRTDAGVHARGQVAHVDLSPLKKPMDPFEITKAINAFLIEKSISVLSAEPVEEDFHARFAAQNKLYIYRILNRPALAALEKNLVWHVKQPLDVRAMHEAAQILTGYHDFTTFRGSQCQAKSPERTLDRLDIYERPYDSCGGCEIIIEAEARSFLHHQVRNMVGTLSLIGLGKWTAKNLGDALKACDRTQGGPSAPAAGLYLVRVDY